MNEDFNTEVVNAELVAPTANVLEVQERSSIDMQIATAKKYPRSPEMFLKRAVAMATLDEETAESCIYRRPVGKDNDTGKQNYAEGLSVRMAEIVGACYGNVRVGARVVEMSERYVKVQGAGHDLETNYYATSEVVESTVNRYGKPYDERMRVVIVKAALAKAYRDVMFKIVPRAMAKPVEKQVRQLLYGDIKSLTVRRAAAEGWIKKLGIDTDRVYAAIGVTGIADMNAKELELLSGLKTAIIDKEITIDEAFPEIKKDKVFDEMTATSEPEKTADKKEAESEQKDLL